MKTAIVAGALANKPGNGGEAWVRMSWARGLARLGFDVWFAEALDRPRAEGDRDGPAAGRGDPDPASDPAVRFFDEVTAAHGFAERRVLLVDGRPRFLDEAGWRSLVGSADLLVNISGHLKPDAALAAIPRRVYVDLDPGYTQIWDARGLLGDDVRWHDAHYTVGLNVGTPGCEIPVNGTRWRPVLQPVVLDDWPATGSAAANGAGAPGRADDPNGAGDPDGGLRFTTIASWRGAFGPIEHGGRAYGVKAHEWRRFRGLPGRLPAHRFEAALAIHEADGADRGALLDDGWRLEDPAARAGSMDAFRAYVADSDAEFSVAQGVYVGSRSGWFSDRSARYLAAGRPVLVQDTGFGRVLPEGEGVVAFRTMDDAVRGAEAIAADYPAHASAARRLAETRFDSDRVLGELLDELEIAP